MKPIHRLIVTSSLYRMQSTAGGPDDPNLTRDPANTYYWRMNPRRMEAEAVRDNVLHIAGNLDPAMGGPDLDPGRPDNDAPQSLLPPCQGKARDLFRLFDSPNVLSCYRRSESVVPQQALALANSSLCREQARLLARQLEHECFIVNDNKFHDDAFERILGPVADLRRTSHLREFLKIAGRSACRSQPA